MSVRKKNKPAAGHSRQSERKTRQAAATIRSVRGKIKKKVSSFITPMLASLHDAPFDDRNWLFEIKWDGYRAIAEKKQKDVRLYSRNGLSFLELYPRVAESLRNFKDEMVLDGEIVVLNSENKPDFQKLQQYFENQSLPIVYYVFDILSYKGKSLTHLPLIERKEILKKILPDDDVVRYSDHVEKDGKAFFARASKMNLEGIIAKKSDSIYQPGKRTKEWLKIKNHNTQEAIIVGYTAPRGSRSHFGSLLLAVREKNKLRYIGHTGTGYTQALLQTLYTQLQPLRRDSSPLAEKIHVNAPVTWVEPELVCNVKYTEMTADGIMRHPVFQGLRIDKDAKDDISLDKPAAKKTPAKNDPPSSRKKALVEVDGHTLTLTNQDKVYFPDDGITKGDVLDYYRSIHKYILPYLKDRPQSLKRNPNGISNPGFFHKDAGDSAPDWVKSVSLRAESANRNIDYIICNDLATLLYLNNLGCIELNPWSSRVNKLDHPDYLAIDLDPSDTNTFEVVIEAARVIHDILQKAGAPAFCKTSGASGLHIYVPLGARYSYEEAVGFAELVANLTMLQLPKTTTLERSISKRNGKMYLDYLQNRKGQTLASVYSIRPKPGATVSAPLHWKEVKPGLHPSQFHMRNMLKRIEKHGDIFSGVLREKTDIRKCIRNLEK